MDHTDKGIPPTGLRKWLENVWCKSQTTSQLKTKAWWGTFPSSHQGSMTPTGMTVCKPAAAELIPHKLAPFHFAIPSVSPSFMYTFLPTSTTCNPHNLATSTNQHWFPLICVTSRSTNTYWSHHYIETKWARNNKASNLREVICHRSEQLHDHSTVRIILSQKNYPKLHNPLTLGNMEIDWWTSRCCCIGQNSTNNILTCSCNLVTFFLLVLY